MQLRDRLLAVGAIRHLDDRDHELTDRGQHLVERLDIDLAALRASRRVFARSCVDWTDRRIHLAGALPAAITSVFIARGWLTRGRAAACTSAAVTTTRSMNGWPPDGAESGH